jgi:hypothetical protein
VFEAAGSLQDAAISMPHIGSVGRRIQSESGNVKALQAKNAMPPQSSAHRSNGVRAVSQKVARALHILCRNCSHFMIRAIAAMAALV